MMEEEQSSLIERKEQDDNCDGRIVVPRRRIIVEPILIAFVFFTLPSTMISSQYILSTFLSELGVNGTSHNTTCNGLNETSNGSDPTKNLHAEAQSKAAYFSLYLGLLQGIPAAITGIFLGNYSDKVGRKYAIVPPCLGLTLKSACFVLVIALKGNIYYLFIGAFLDGLCGSFTTLLCGCLAYVTDITSVENRTFRITIVELCMLLPAMVSSIGTGYLIRATGYLIPFILVFAGLVLCTAYGIFGIPETIIKDHTARFFTVQHLKQASAIYFKDDGSGRSICLILLLCSLIGPFLVAFSNSMDVLFQMNFPLCWGSVTIGIYSAAVIAVVAVGGLVFAHSLRNCLKDYGVIIIAGLSTVANFCYKSIVKNTTMMFLSLVFYPLSFLTIPTTRSLMSKHVKPTEYGGLFSGISAVEAICTVMSNVIFNPVYAETNSFWPGAVYVVMGSVVLSGVLFFMMYMLVARRRGDIGDATSIQVNSSDASESQG